MRIKGLNSMFYLSPEMCRQVSTTEEYKALPKEQREKNGWYLIPFGLAVNLSDMKNKKRKSEWDLFYDYVRQEYPIQWFFRYWITSWDNPLYSVYKLNKMRYDEFYYTVRRYFKPYFPRWRASCKRHQYTDIVELSIKSNFALILDYWHEEVARDTVNWNADGHHKQFYKELKAAVKYIEVDRKKLEDKADKELTKATKRAGTYEVKYKKHNQIEETINNKDTEILHWFIDNRNYFWT
jgi:hypothetical protein